MPVIFPYLHSLRLAGFRKLFVRDDITLDLRKEVFVVLGGNGLGKTTILQALVYGVAGGLDTEELEPQKNLRWDHSYFHGRLDGHVRDAFVEVAFGLGEATLLLRRGFGRSQVTHFTLSTCNGEQTWVGSAAGQEYKNAVCDLGGFGDFEDYRFLVHRLVYLAEDRRGITWDLDAQLRAMMLLNPQAVDEREFSDLRARVKKHDSDLRHAVVRINHAEDELKRRSIKVPGFVVESDNQKASESLAQLPIFEEELEGLLNRRAQLVNRIRALDSDESALRQAVADLAAARSDVEANALARALASAEESSVLYVHRLLHKGICPSCGQKARGLQELALDRASKLQCPICGLGDGLIHPVEPAAQGLDSQISEKLRAKNHIDLELSDLRYQLEQLVTEETQLRTAFELTRMAAGPALAPPSKVLDPKKLDSLPEDVLVAELQRNRDEKARLDRLLDSGIRALESKYGEYVAVSRRAQERLVELFEDLAEKFLGTKVTLVTAVREGDDKFVRYSLYVPRFDGIVRETPEQCSEAQRFFLDIAMRMALLQLASELSQEPNTFICETPESALDVSYVDNAATMTLEFVKRGHRFVATTNLQRLGLAFRLLEKSQSRGLQAGVFDMLAESNLLSEVQKNSDDLRNIRDEILGAASK